MHIFGYIVIGFLIVGMLLAATHAKHVGPMFGSQECHR